jgi:hypothetical protein
MIVAITLLHSQSYPRNRHKSGQADRDLQKRQQITLLKNVTAKDKCVGLKFAIIWLQTLPTIDTVISTTNLYIWPPGIPCWT